MGGIIYHLIFACISAAIVYYNFRKPQYSAAIFIGNFLHDIFVLAYVPILLKTLDPIQIVRSSYFIHRDSVFLVLWMAIQTIFVMSFLFLQKYVRKKEFMEFEYNVGFFLMGIITHASIDMIIQEAGIWI